MVEDINSALVEMKRPIMYKAMKYWGKKPHNIFRTYIEHYSESNQIVLDPFSGSGICALEAIQADRKAIAIDLNPVAMFLTKMTAKQMNVAIFQNEWETLHKKLNEFEEKFEYFKTTCPRCKKKARIITTHFDGETPILIRFACSCQKKVMGKQPDKNDLKTLEESKKLVSKWWFPQDKFPNSPTFFGAKKMVGEYYAGCWTERTLYCLSYLFDCIESIENSDNKEFMKFGFTSMVHLVTKMVSARREKSHRPDSGSWGRPAYLFPKRHMETNPFVAFERAIIDKQGIIKSKRSSNKLIGNKARFAKNFEDLQNDKSILILKRNAVELSSFIPAESVDYVLTDPPYGGLIQYFDLSSLWAVWLKGKEQNNDFSTNFNEEIIIHKKNETEQYEKMLLKSFTEINKVLKPNKYLTVTFHNDNPFIFNLIIKVCILSGFFLEKILYQMNRRASESGVAHPWGTAVSDFYLRFRKPTPEEKKREGLNKGNFERMVVESAKNTIIKRWQPTEFQHILNGAYVELYKFGQYLETSQEEISNLLKRRVGIEFTLVENKLWLAHPEKEIAHQEIPLNERVERVITETLNREIKISYEQILQTLFTEFPNAQTPDYTNIKQLLKEYANKTSDGKWIIKKSFQKYASTHITMIKFLAEIGKNFGFKIYAPNKNLDSILQEICENELPIKADKEKLDRMKQIDILWFKDGRIHYAFEVENATTITSALERASNLAERKFTKKFIIIPIERTKLLNRKIKEPMFKETFEKDKWQIGFYETLINFRKNMNRQGYDLEKFEEKLSERIEEPEETQKTATQKKLGEGK